MSYNVEVWPQVQEFYSGLGLTYRREVKRALVLLKEETGDIKALGDDLESYLRLRVGPFRIIFRYREGRIIECVYMNRRSIVYDVFEREVIDRLKSGEK